MTTNDQLSAEALATTLLIEIQDAIRPYIDHHASCSMNVNAANPDGDYCDCGVRAATTRANTKAAELLVLLRQREAAAQRAERLEYAIRWALGEVGEFGEEPPPLAGKYRQRFWWRTKLRELAGLSTITPAPEEPRG